MKDFFLGYDAAEAQRRRILPWPARPEITANAGNCGGENPRRAEASRGFRVSGGVPPAVNEGIRAARHLRSERDVIATV